MKFLDRFIGKKNKVPELAEAKRPDNAVLTNLLNSYSQNQSRENYFKTLKEIEEGNSFFILPSVNDGQAVGGWKMAKVNSTLKLTSVFNLDGLKVLGAFTDEKALLNWTKKPTPFTKLRSQDAIQFCKQNGIDRIVINSDQPNMFILERNRDNFKTTVLEKETPIQIGTPINPLSKQILDNLVINFRNVDTIQEAYHYAQSLNNEFSLVIGVLLSVVSENSNAALYNAINSSLQGEKLGTPVDISVIQTEDQLNAVRNIKDSLFYKR